MLTSHHARCVALVTAFLCASFLISELSNSVRAQEPEQPATTTRGIQLYEQGDLQSAAKVLEAVVAKNHDDADAWYYLGLARYRQGWIGAALSPFERVVELRPDSADARAKLSYALILANEAEKALAMAQSAIALGDQSAEPHYAIAEASLRTASSLKPAEDTIRTKALERAIEDADIALKLNSNFSLALITRSFALSKLKRYSEAAASLERFLSISPEDLDADMWREQLTALQASDENFTKTVTGNSEVLAPREVTTKTRVLSKPEPSYTETARQKGVVGTVVLRAVFSSGFASLAVWPDNRSYAGSTPNKIYASYERGPTGIHVHSA